MKFLKTLALVISCSLLITAPVFAGQKHINKKNGYEIKLVDGDISAMLQGDINILTNFFTF